MTENSADSEEVIAALLKSVGKDPSLLQAIAILSSAGLSAYASSSPERIKAWAYAITKDRVRAVQEQLKDLANQEAAKTDLEQMAEAAQRFMDRMDAIEEEDLEAGQDTPPFG